MSIIKNSSSKKLPAQTRQVSDYAEAVNFLYRLQLFGVKLGLEKIGALLGRLGNPQDQFTSVHIAGTNGKGTCAAVLDAVLRGHGICCGLYTSPHLLDLGERATVGGAPVPQDFVFAWVRANASYILEQRVTFFEAVTALAFCYFRERNVQAAAVEVGLGGRYDATNVIEPALCIITSVGMDHRKWLGRTLAAIAREKAGIIKTGVPVLCGERRGRALEVIEETCSSLGCRLTLLDQTVSPGRVKTTGRGMVFSHRGSEIFLENLEAPLYGAHQARNAALGLLAAEYLLNLLGREQSESATREALKNLAWPGRFQRLVHPRGVEFVLDVAHNRPAAIELAATFRRVYGKRRAVVVAALAGDKDPVRFFRPLIPLAERFLLPKVDFGRAETSKGQIAGELLQKVIAALGGTSSKVSSISQALDLALEVAGQQGIPVLVTGSFHLVGPALSCLNTELRVPEPV